MPSKVIIVDDEQQQTGETQWHVLNEKLTQLTNKLDRLLAMQEAEEMEAEAEAEEEAEEEAEAAEAIEELTEIVEEIAEAEPEAEPEAEAEEEEAEPDLSLMEPDLPPMPTPEKPKQGMLSKILFGEKG